MVNSATNKLVSKVEGRELVLERVIGVRSVREGRTFNELVRDKRLAAYGL